MSQDKLKSKLEAALMVADEPLGVDRLLRLFRPRSEEVPTREEIRAAIEGLRTDYEGRGIELKEVASGFRIQVRSEFAEWVNRVWEEKSPRYSRALLETLAIIAYRQPITRGEVENIRGVSVSTGIMKTLLEREWVRVAGHRDVPGRPAVYTTTREFLDYFNLKSLTELPSLAELRDIDDINPDLFADQSLVEPIAVSAEQAVLGAEISQATDTLEAEDEVEDGLETAAQKSLGRSDTVVVHPSVPGPPEEGGAEDDDSIMFEPLSDRAAG